MNDRTNRPGRGGRPNRTGDKKGTGSGPRPERREARPGSEGRSERDERPRSGRPASSRPSARPTGPRSAGSRPRPDSRSEARSEREERPRTSRPATGRPSTRSTGTRGAGSGPRPDRRGAGRGDQDERPRSAGPRHGKAAASRPTRPDSSEGRGEREERPRTGKSSKRAGKRPPRAMRDGRPEDSRPGSERPAPRSSRPGRPSRPFGDRPRPAGERPEFGAKRHTGRGPDRNSKRGRQAEEGLGDGTMRLNRYLSNAGIASRREADDLIKAGVVQVNGVIVTEMGTKVGPGDRVHYGGQRLSTEKKRYVLVNKPKDFITTTDDPRDRRTVMALIDDACTERLYPVGRLDRNTTGLLLMTNDGDLAKKLTHPSHGAEKLYHVTLDKSVTQADLEKLVEGVELDDGSASADEASYVQGATKREVGLKLHMGRNRVVRRMFEALGYDVVKLDRVAFAGLTKRDLPRGNWRHLSEKEVLFLSKRK